MHLPTFSVVIPTKDEEKYLPKLLVILRTQTLQPKEIIVADACSTDATRDIALNLGARVVDGGLPSVGRNAGAAVASGELLLFLDADVDLSSNDIFERVISEFARRDLDLATVDVANNKISVKLYNWYVRLWSAKHPHLPGFFILAKRTLHDKIKGFDETVIFLEDHDYGYRAVKQAGARFAFLNSARIGISFRRFARDGFIIPVTQYILAELYYFVFGPIRHNLFRYRFGYKK